MISSTLETLPDELLLDVCKYLLCIDILQSFFDLNQRMTRLISDYRYHVSLHKASFAQSTYIYNKVFPKIGLHVRTLVIDRLYSVLQHNMFYQYFSNQRLSNIFPRLEKVTLVSFRYETSLPFIHMLDGFEHLVELDIRKLFPISHEHQSAVLETLMKANNQRISSLRFSDCWSSLHLDNLSDVCYSNIIHLQITMITLNDALSLFAAIPNVRQLNITLTDNNSIVPFNNETASLIHLNKFRLSSIQQSWSVEDLIVILNCMPNIECLSLQLCTYDERLVDGQKMRLIQQSLHRIQQFVCRLYYIADRNEFNREAILESWLPCSIECLVDETRFTGCIFAYIYTLPSSSEFFTKLELPGNIINKSIACKNSDEKIEQLDIYSVSSFTNCLPVMTHWSRMKQLTIWFSNTASTLASMTGEQHQQTLLFPKMIHLKQLSLIGSVPFDVHHLSSLLAVAPNLIRLNLNFDSLLPLLDSEQASRLLRQRITALFIYKSSSSSTVLEEHHITRIVCTFPRLRHMFANLTHLLPSMDSIILRILTEFKNCLVSLGADGPPSNEMKVDARQWLEDNNTKNNNTIVHPTQFDACFIVESNRLFIWM